MGGTAVAAVANMLRITALSPRIDGCCLRVEGRLVGDWVEVLRLEVERARLLGSKLQLDLAGVEFADPAALTLLLMLSEQDVELVACSPLLLSLLASKAS